MYLSSRLMHIPFDLQEIRSFQSSAYLPVLDVPKEIDTAFACRFTATTAQNNGV